MSVLLIGLGNMGRKYLSKFEELGLKPTLCDLNSALKEEFKNYNFYCYYDRIEETPQKVFVVVNPEHHPRIAEYFLSKGSSVFLEKPPALSSKEFQTLLERFGSKNLAVSEIERYSVAVRDLKNLNPERVSIKRLNPRKGYINPFWDIGWHDFYLLLYLFRDFKITEVEKLGKYHYLARGYLKNGAPLEYELAWEYGGAVRRDWSLQTPEGELVLDFLNERRLLNGRVVAERTEGDKLREMVEDFLKDNYNAASADRALKVLKKLEKLKERFEI
jgi:predicted dehydrogenase